MKLLICILFPIFLAGCTEEKKQKETIPVYKVDLDRLDTVSFSDIFSEIKLIPLQKTPKSEVGEAEMGIYKDRYILFDHVWKRVLCFDADGKFKYTVNDDRMVAVKSSTLHNKGVLMSILKPLRYFYAGDWHYYLTFRTDVWKQTKDQSKKNVYRWDFGQYNTPKDTLPPMPKLPFPELVHSQQKWLHENAGFALSEIKETDRYLYALVERLFKRTEPQEQCVHLLYDKKNRTYKLFQGLAEGMKLKTENTMTDSSIMMLVQYNEKDKYISPALLSPADMETYKSLSPESYPVIVWCKLKN